MSWRPFHEVMALVSALPVGAPAKLVLLAVLRYANREGLAWPGLKALAADTGLSNASVRRAIGELKEKLPKEQLDVQRIGKRQANRYVVLVDWVIAQPEQSPGGVSAQIGPVVIAQPEHRSKASKKQENPDAIALSKLNPEEQHEYQELLKCEPGTPKLELVGKARRAVARRSQRWVDDGVDDAGSLVLVWVSPRRNVVTTNAKPTDRLKGLTNAHAAR